jgi:light-regulated signal transduction histidine kinase (bacteriophytochrome)
LIEISRTKDLFSINFTLPVIVFFLGLLTTLFVWQIIHSHIKINRLLSKQKDIIEGEVLLKTEELRTQATELTTTYNRQLELTEELEAFCYSVSHDLRAPLRSINGFSQILHEDYSDVLSTEAKGYLSRTSAAADKMGNIIEDLLKLSRIARSNIETETVNLSELAEKSVQDMEEYEPNRRVSVSIQKNIDAHGNAKLLQIAFDNLIGNAWKYSKETTGAHIEFGMEQKDNEAMYYVRDNGVGFDMRYKGKLFIAFQRLHHSSEFEGSGIGLATVRRIIQKHNGRIWANSETGKGSTFYFTLGESVNSSPS